MTANHLVAAALAATTILSAAGFVALRLLDRRVVAWANVTDGDVR